MNHFSKISDKAVEIPLRSPDVVMKLERLGSLFPNRLSFARTLVRRMAKENWCITKEKFDLDNRGIGTAIYKINTPITPVWFVVFADDLEASERTDRVIAEKWDATFALTTKEPDEEKLRYLKENIPLQEAGRCTSDEIILSRANKSVRLFNYVTEKLALGQQPNPAKLIDVGYLLRTTAVYGNGKFGLADFEYMRRQGLFTLPFQAEMLCVYLARTFSFDWVEHIARKTKPTTWCRLDDNLKRGLGVGNATGLGMAPFLVNHPKLISNWILTRERALLRIKEIQEISAAKRRQFSEILKQAQMHIEEWSTTDPRQAKVLSFITNELDAPPPFNRFLSMQNGWHRLTDWSTKNLSIETQELINSILIELYPELVDNLELETGADDNMPLVPSMALHELKDIIDSKYDWVMAFENKEKANNARFWYASENKEEPRFGWRYLEPGAEKELRIGIAQEVQNLKTEIARRKPTTSKLNVAEFLISKPEFREIIKRIQNLQSHPYAEIRDNLLADICRPINLLRCKLAMFGATKFDPKSDLWIRITLFQGAPIKEQLSHENLDNWLFPSLKNGF